MANFMFTLENPFPGGSTLALVEVFKYDDGEWYWRDYMDHYMGPWPSFSVAKSDAEQTYERGWRDI